MNFDNTFSLSAGVCVCVFLSYNRDVPEKKYCGAYIVRYLLAVNARECFFLFLYVSVIDLRFGKMFFSSDSVLFPFFFFFSRCRFRFLIFFPFFFPPRMLFFVAVLFLLVFVYRYKCSVSGFVLFPFSRFFFFFRFRFRVDVLHFPSLGGTIPRGANIVPGTYLAVETQSSAGAIKRVEGRNLEIFRRAISHYDL